MASKRFWNSYIQVWTLKTQCTKVIPFSLQLRFSQLLFPEACDRCELHALILRNQESLRGNHVNNGSCLKVEVGRFNTGKPQGFTVKCGCNIFISLASSYLHTLHILLDEKKKKTQHKRCITNTDDSSVQQTALCSRNCLCFSHTFMLPGKWRWQITNLNMLPVPRKAALFFSDCPKQCYIKVTQGNCTYSWQFSVSFPDGQDHDDTEPRLETNASCVKNEALHIIYIYFFF